MASSKTKLSLKLLIDTKGQRVIFAESSKEFVDFLFSLLSLPIGMVTKLISTKSMVGSIGKVYESVETLSDTYKKASPAAFDALLNPKLHTSATVPLLFPHIQKEHKVDSTGFYMCNCDYKKSSCYDHVTSDPSAMCPSNGRNMDRRIAFVDPPNNISCSSRDGCVKGVTTYMIMDDLEVRPTSAISGVIMLNKFGIKDIAALEEKVVDVGMEEGVELLKASLHSKAVLTEVFLVNKGMRTIVSVCEVDSLHFQELFLE